MSETEPAALNGVTVVEIATLGAAPWAASFLAEYGATVIKVEDPVGGDPLRDWGTQKNGVGLLWKTIGRNKKSVTMNLRVPEGRELLDRLLARSDVLIANSRPPTMRRWGLSYDQLRVRHPNLVVLHTTAFGAYGPYSERPGFGTLVEAMSGFAHITGEPDGPPTLPAVPLADFVAAVTGANAVMMALYARAVNGAGGQMIDLSIMESLTRSLEATVIEYDQLGSIPVRQGNRWAVTVPRNTYLTRDGRWVAMSGSAPTVALRVFEAIGRPELIEDPDYNTAQARLAKVDEIDAMVAAWIAERDLDEVMSVFETHGVAGAPVYDAQQLTEDPNIQAREVFVKVKDPDLGEVLVQSPVARLSGTPGRITHLGPPLGAHTAEVFADLGISQDEIDELRAKGVC